MNTLEKESKNAIFKNPLLKSVCADLRKKIVIAFPKIAKVKHDRYLSLSKYFKQSPQIFYSKKAYLLFSLWMDSELINNRNRILQILSNESKNISESIVCLYQIGTSDWHDRINWDFDYDFLPFAEGTLHPTYLRILEGPFAVVMGIPALVSKIDRNKSTEGLSLYNSKK